MALTLASTTAFAHAHASAVYGALIRTHPITTSVGASRAPKPKPAPPSSAPREQPPLPARHLLHGHARRLERLAHAAIPRRETTRVGGGHRGRIVGRGCVFFRVRSSPPAAAASIARLDRARRHRLRLRVERGGEPAPIRALRRERRGGSAEGSGGSAEGTGGGLRWVVDRRVSPDEEAP